MDLKCQITDPDGDTYSVIWEHFDHFSTYSGKEKIRVFEPWKECTRFMVPSDAQSGEYIVLILRVQDQSITPMTSYGQVVIHII